MKIIVMLIAGLMLGSPMAMEPDNQKIAQAKKTLDLQAKQARDRAAERARELKDLRGQLEQKELELAADPKNQRLQREKTSLQG
jgi:hypothetical protein